MKVRTSSKSNRIVSVSITAQLTLTLALIDTGGAGARLGHLHSFASTPSTSVHNEGYMYRQHLNIEDSVSTKCWEIKSAVRISLRQ